MNVFGVENRDTLTHKATGVLFLTCILMFLFSPFLPFHQMEENKQ